MNIPYIYIPNIYIYILYIYNIRTYTTYIYVYLSNILYDMQLTHCIALSKASASPAPADSLSKVPADNKR